MAKNNDALPNSDLSESNNKMTDSNFEDDTEDYIQPSQPLSFQSPGVESASRRIAANLDETSISTIEETLPFPKLISTPFGEVSRDFIPESENPVKRKIETLEIEEDCKKRLNLDLSSVIKETPDLFSMQSQLNDTIDAAQSKVSQKSSLTDLENVSLVPESPPKISEIVESEHSYTMFSETHKRGVLEETAAEDSFNVGSPDLYATDKTKANISNIREQEKLDIVDETSTIESPSKFIDDSGMSSLLRSDKLTDVEGKTNVASQETGLDNTIDAEDISCFTPFSSDRKDVEEMSKNKISSVSESLSSPVEGAATESVITPIDTKPETCRLKSVLKNISDEELARLQKHSTPENPLSKSPKINESTSSIENGTPPVQDVLLKSSEINFTVCLQLDCQVLIDPLKGEPISKKIVNVKELPKRQPKHSVQEPNSDTSYKTKRLSSSSSGSVYSDKTGLPYALPNRSLPMSNNSSSSSVDLTKHVQIVGRQVWVNEYKIPLAIDEIIPKYIELHKSNLANIVGKPGTKRKGSLKMRKKSHWSHPLDNVLESSGTEQSSGNNSDDLLQRLDNPESTKPNSPKDVLNPSHKSSKPEEAEDMKETVLQEDDILKKESCDNETVENIVTEGLLVFARWTDKRYYPGIVQSKAKYDRWDVKFDDGTEKVIREDLILPLKWLTKGELVFALVADKYVSGKIADIVREEDIQFKIELDDTNEEVIVKKCDICLNEVMAGIIREKFKPTIKAAPPLKPCDIDVDNVVTGKRVREQRTPIRGVTSILQSEGSTAKKRRGLRFSEDGANDNQTPRANPELQSEKKTRYSSRKKTSTSSMPPDDVRPEVEDVEKSTDARKKRGRTLKYDSDKTETQAPEIQKESSNASKMESAIDVGEKADTKLVERKVPRKVVKSHRGKKDKGGGRISTRPKRNKPLTASQDVKGKKKNA